MMEQFSKEYIDFIEKNKLLPLKETAKILNLHPATLRSFAKTNSIKHLRIGKKYYFNIEDIKNDVRETIDLPQGVILNNGYIKVNVGKDFPSADANGYIPLHKLIFDAYQYKQLNRNILDPIITFKNNNTLDIRINNLEIKLEKAE